jgi:DNA-directed RNA polymerase subunit K/omega
VIQLPPGVGLFEFTVLATMRAQQLIRGCKPRVVVEGKLTTVAQLEIAAGVVARLDEGALHGSSHASPPSPGLEAHRPDPEPAFDVTWTPPWR